MRILEIRIRPEVTTAGMLGEAMVTAGKADNETECPSQERLVPRAAHVFISMMSTPDPQTDNQRVLPGESGFNPNLPPLQDFL